MSEKVKFAIIGCGKAANKHIKAAYHNKDTVELVAISDLNTNSMNSLLNGSKFLKKEKNKIMQFKDYIEMLEKTHPQVVSIVTPGGTHFTIGKEVILRGINILLEKPMALTIRETQILNEKAKFNNVKIAMGHIYRYFPIVGLIQKDIQKGLLGKILYGDVKVFWGHDQEYYDNPKWRGTWAQDGGVLMNQSIHAIDLMTYLMNGKAIEASAMLASQTHEMEAEDLGIGLLRLDNDSLITLTGTTSSDPNMQEASFKIMCTDGMVNAGISSGKPYFNIKVRSNKSGKLKSKTFHYLKRYISEVISSHGFSWLLKIGSPHSWILKDLVSSIKTNSSPIADGLSGELSVQNVIALYNSAKLQSTIKIPVDEQMSNSIFTMNL